MSIAKIIKCDENKSDKGKNYVAVKENELIYDTFILEKENKSSVIALIRSNKGKLYPFFLTEEAAKMEGLKMYYKDSDINDALKNDDIDGIPSNIIFLHDEPENISMDINKVNSKLNELRNIKCVKDVMTIADYKDSSHNTIEYILEFGYWYYEDDKKYGMVIKKYKDDSIGAYTELVEDDVNNNTIIDKMISLFKDIIINKLNIDRIKENIKNKNCEYYKNNILKNLYDYINQNTPEHSTH